MERLLHQHTTVQVPSALSTEELQHYRLHLEQMARRIHLSLSLSLSVIYRAAVAACDQVLTQVSSSDSPAGSAACTVRKGRE